MKSYNIENIIALHPIQEGMLFHSLDNANNDEYVSQIILTLNLTINPDVCLRTWDKVVSENETLRSIILWENLKAPVQVVLRDSTPDINYYEYNENVFSQEIVKKLADKERSVPLKFDMVPFRVSYYQFNSDVCIMIITNHHILYDGSSNSIIIREFFNSYSEIQNKTSVEKKNELSLNKVKLNDYVKYLQQHKTEDSEFWKMYLNNIGIKAITLSTIQGTNQPKAYDFVDLRINEELQKTILKFTSDNEITPAVLFYAAWGVLLSRITYNDEIVCGTTVSLRDIPLTGIENTVGLFVNTLPLVFKINTTTTFRSLLTQIKQSFLEINDRSYTSLSDIKRYGGIADKDEIFDNLIVVENYSLNALSLYDSSVIVNYEVIEYTNYTFTLDISMFSDINLRLSFKTQKINKIYAEQMLARYQLIIQQIINNIDSLIYEGSILLPADKKVLKEFQSVEKSTNAYRKIHHYVEDIAVNQKNKTAIIYKNSCITYNELNKFSNHLAWLLIENGIKPSDNIAIMMERSPLMVQCILGIWKVGAVYIPIEPEYPIDRINTMLEESDAKCLLTIEQYNFVIPNTCNIINLDRINLDHFSCDNPCINTDINSLAYIIFTSGTTGKPKGAMIEHIGMMNHIAEKVESLKMESSSIVSQNASHCFDISIWQFFAAMTVGASIVIYPNDLIMETEKFLEEVKQDRISILEVVPTYLDNILLCLKKNDDCFQNIKYMLVTGETLKKDLATRWFEKFDNIPLVNAYGPTEASDDITHYFMYDFPANTKIPVGKPIRNMQIYVVDKSFHLCPVGVIGEICVAGIGVGRGYINNERETHDAFVINPFTEDKMYNRLYKTGDLGYWEIDGNILLLGRIDHQIKINGFRIELAEVENYLALYPGIRDAAAIVRTLENGKNVLCAYYIADFKIDILDLKEFLSNHVPQYMIPHVYVSLKELPVSSNGKVDKSKLPELEPGNQEEKLFASNDIEIKLSQIWMEVLAGNELDISIDDDFFELGGNSLKLTRLKSLIHKHFNIDIPIQKFYIASTIKQQAFIMESMENCNFQEIPLLPKQEYYPLSYNQQRIWYIYQLDQQSPAWNMYGRLSLNSENDLKFIKNIEKSIIKIIERHESLRTQFDLINGEVMQKILDVVICPLKHMDLSFCDKHEKQKRRDEIFKEIAFKPFDLSYAPLFNVTLINLGDNKFDLIFNIHHIISDGWSMEIMKKEFFQFYNHIRHGNELILTPLKIQYKDYAAWHNEWLKDSNNQDKPIQFWKSQLEKGFPIMSISKTADLTIPRNIGAGYMVYLDETLKNSLWNAARKWNTTLFTVMYTAFNLFLSFESGQEEVICGIPAAGRVHSDTHDLIGFFINPLPIRTKINNMKNFEFNLKYIEKSVQEALEYQSFPLELVLDDLKMKFPDITVYFDMLNQKESEKHEDIHSFENYHPVWVQDAKYDLYLLLTEYRNGIEIFWNYRPSLFSDHTIERFANTYKKILEKTI